MKFKLLISIIALLVFTKCERIVDPIGDPMEDFTKVTFKVKQTVLHGDTSMVYFSINIKVENKTLNPIYAVEVTADVTYPHPDYLHEQHIFVVAHKIDPETMVNKTYEFVLKPYISIEYYLKYELAI